MFCSECGSSNAENAKFCYQCGQAIRFPQSGTAPKTVSPKPPVNKSKNNVGQVFSSLFIAITVVFIIIAGIIGVNVFLEDQRRQSSFQRPAINAANAPGFVAPASTPNQQQIINDSLAIAPQEMRYFQINLNADSRVYGNFGASGGSNDIDCYVVDEMEFVNLANGNSFRSFYSNKNVTVGKLDLRLAAGKYYLVFDNRKAFMTNKVVKAKIWTEN